MNITKYIRRSLLKNIRRNWKYIKKNRKNNKRNKKNRKVYKKRFKVNHSKKNRFNKVNRMLR